MEMDDFARAAIRTAGLGPWARLFIYVFGKPCKTQAYDNYHVTHLIWRGKRYLRVR